jgi:hypothetical protein
MGVIAYYVKVTNTNSGVNGIKTATVNSNPATVTVTGDGASGVAFTVWVNGDGSLISDMPELTDISRSFGEKLTIKAADGLTGLRWSINSEDIPGPRGEAQSIVIEANNFPVGYYTLGLYAEKAGVPYSINITFVVDN